MNKKQIIEKVFDEHMTKVIENFKAEFIQDQLLFNNSEETDESLAKKAVRIQEYMAQGKDFNEACDEKDVFIGSLDSEYIYNRYVLKANNLSFEEWFEKRIQATLHQNVELRKRR